MQNKLRRFFISDLFLPIPLLIGMAGLIELSGDNSLKIVSMIVNALILALILFLSDDILPAIMPAFCVIIVGASMLATLEEVIPFIPFAFPVALGTVYFLIRNRRPIYFGSSFYGLIATSVAILVSGMGTAISSRDYTSLAAVYHLIGLSVGLIALYCLFAANRREQRSYDPIRYFLMALMLLGLLCTAVMTDNLVEWILTRPKEGEDWPRVILNLYYKNIPYRNTVATLSVMCLPSAFYMAKQSRHQWGHILFFFFGLLIYFGAVLSTARTALLFGTILLVICVIYYLWGRKNWGLKCFNLMLFLICAGVGIYLFRDDLMEILLLRLTDNAILSPNETRVKMLIRSIEDFIAHPLFGIGITSTANSDLYAATGCIGWYHMYFPQLWGSMGLCGLACYTFQLVLRAKLVLSKPDTQTVAMGLVYLGLFLYSQTDPGEFAPIPYAVLAVALFVLLEGKKKSKSQSELIPKAQ